MSMKLIFSAAAFAVSICSVSSIASASPLGLCGTNNVNCPPPAEKKYVALGRVKPAPVALGKVKLPPVQKAPAESAPDTSTEPEEASYDDGISCGEGRNIVRHSGFHQVHTMDCSDDVFTYSAVKHNQPFKVFVNAQGYIVHVSNIYY